MAHKGGGNGKKQSKKAKRREERARQQQQQRKTVSPKSDSPLTINEQPEGMRRTIGDDRTESRSNEEVSRQQNSVQPANATTAVAAEVEKTEKEPPMRVPKGLPNLGNTCFFNSTMQCLLTTWPFLRHYFDALIQTRPVCVPSSFSTRVYDTEVKVPKMELHLAHDFPMPTFWIFAKFVESFHQDNIRPSPRELFDQISRKVPRFRGMAQQDAHELLHYLMNMLRQEEVARFQQAFVTSTVQHDEDDEDNSDNADDDQQQNGQQQQQGGDTSKGQQQPTHGQRQQKQQQHRYNTRQQKRNMLSSLSSRSTSRPSSDISRGERRRRFICQALLNGPGRPVLDAVYGGVLQQTIKCDRCAHVSVALEPFFDLSLPVKSVFSAAGCSSAAAAASRTYSERSGAVSVECALRLFTAEELLCSDTHAYRCENCTKPKKGAQQKGEENEQPKSLPVVVNALKRYKVLSPPLVLTLHINRFEQHGRVLRKFNGHVQFPLVLNLAPFCSPNVHRLRPGQQRHLLLYRLCGVVSHSGGMSGGHYIAFVGRYPPRSDDDGSHCQPVDALFKLALHCPTSTAPGVSSAHLTDQMGALTLANNTNNSVNNTDGNAASSSANDDDGGHGSGGEEADSDNQQQNDNASNGAAEIEQQALEEAKHRSKWFYCSDSSVHSVKVDEVLCAQAFLLFYERIY